MESVGLDGCRFVQIKTENVFLGLKAFDKDVCLYNYHSWVAMDYFY